MEASSEPEEAYEAGEPDERGDEASGECAKGDARWRAGMDAGNFPFAFK